MKLNETINRADELIRQAGERLNTGETDNAIATMLDLREFMNEPITDDTPGEDETSETCNSCGQPIKE